MSTPPSTWTKTARRCNWRSEALTTLDIPPIVHATGGGSDANFFNGHGIQTVILSAGYQHPHGTNESLNIDQFVLLTQCLFHIVRLAGERRG